MKELRVNTFGVTDQDANAYILCDCGSLIHIDMLKVRFHNEIITQCEVCKQEIKVIEGK